MRKPKYAVGDIVGVCSDGMYEFRITSLPREGRPTYGARCIRGRADGAVKLGKVYGLREKQVVVRLGAKGRYFRPDEYDPEWLARFPPRMRKSMVEAKRLQIEEWERTGGKPGGS